MIQQMLSGLPSSVCRLLQNTANLLILIMIAGCTPIETDESIIFPGSVEYVQILPDNESVWAFILAGQSNMAGSGLIEPQDTISHSRIFSLHDQNKLIYAKEPIHFYEPRRNGLSSGLSFGKKLIEHIPDSISILLLPAAVGGSSIDQWINDAIHRDVMLLSNFREKVAIAKKYGSLKAVLWHQGESDANEQDIPLYHTNLSLLFSEFRGLAENDTLPILIGELGSFSEHADNWARINEIIHEYSSQDHNTAVIPTSDLKDRGDRIHFNSAAQRILGQRFAKMYLDRFYSSSAPNK